jgi:hypothetical protein
MSAMSDSEYRKGRRVSHAPLLSAGLLARLVT